jgi:hypothetical protein
VFFKRVPKIHFLPLGKVASGSRYEIAHFAPTTVGATTISSPTRKRGKSISMKTCETSTESNGSLFQRPMDLVEFGAPLRLTLHIIHRSRAAVDEHKETEEAELFVYRSEEDSAPSASSCSMISLPLAMNTGDRHANQLTRLRWRHDAGSDRFVARNRVSRLQTKCKQQRGNDLQSRPHHRPQQNSNIPERQRVLQLASERAPNKTPAASRPPCRCHEQREISAELEKPDNTSCQRQIWSTIDLFAAMFRRKRSLARDAACEPPCGSMTMKRFRHVDASCDDDGRPCPCPAFW